MRNLYIAILVFECINVVHLFSYEESAAISDDVDAEPTEPVTLISKLKSKKSFIKNINCNDFANYALKCTIESALMYNSTSKSPPMPSKISEWCKAITFLTNCAIDWNTDCKDVTESHFNEESIRGHTFVVNSICDDQWFLTKYAGLSECIEASKDVWENCYLNFKTLVDEQKNTTREWTHFVTHFHLCCARAQFRRCTLDELFNIPKFCTRDQAVMVQKFSVIISEGDVFQDCDHNMMYKNCLGGDPQPANSPLYKYMTLKGTNISTKKNKSDCFRVQNFSLIFCYVLICAFVK